MTSLWRLSCRQNAYSKERTRCALQNRAGLSLGLHRCAPRWADYDGWVSRRKKMLQPNYLEVFSSMWVKLPTVYLVNKGLYTHTGHYMPEGQRAGLLKATNLRGCFTSSPGNELMLQGREHCPVASWLCSQHAHSVGGKTQRKRFHKVTMQDAILCPPEMYLFCKIKASIFLKILSISCTSVFEPMWGHKVNKILAIKKLGNHF